MTESSGSRRESTWRKLRMRKLLRAQFQIKWGRTDIRTRKKLGYVPENVRFLGSTSFQGIEIVSRKYIRLWVYHVFV